MRVRVWVRDDGVGESVGESVGENERVGKG